MPENEENKMSYVRRKKTGKIALIESKREIGTPGTLPDPFHPAYGTPKGNVLVEATLVCVIVSPLDVTIYVCTVGLGETIGTVLAFRPLRMGMYVLVASSDKTVSPTLAFTDVLNA